MPEKIDYKNLYKDLYLPKTSPCVIDVPEIMFFAVDGKGDPNEEGGAYKKAVEVLYALSYTVKMSKTGSRNLKGYFDYVVPPLEGLWDLSGGAPVADHIVKNDLVWTSLIRQPEFVDAAVFEWACAEAAVKKKLDCAAARFEIFKEGLCVQCMHIGSYDEEAATIEKIRRFTEANGLVNDISKTRRHHEIYSGDPRKGDPSKRKTVIRIPVRKK